MKNLIKRVFQSIPLKICLSILLIETVLLAVLGFYYTSKFNNEIDVAVQQKLLLPSLLMSARALNYDAVNEYDVMSELIQENVVQGFIVNSAGLVFYGAEGVAENTDYRLHLESEERSYYSRDFNKTKSLNFGSRTGEQFISIFSPLTHNDKLLGALYLRIAGDKISEKKQGVAYLFFVGALLTIALTTILEALFVYNLVVPRLERTSQALNEIERYQFATRLREYGPPDQLGRLMGQVDNMISQLEKYMADFIAAEKKYRDLFLTAREGILRVSGDGRLLDGNPALAELLGYDSTEELLSSSKAILDRHIHDPNDKEAVMSMLAATTSIEDYEVQLTKKDGTVVTASLSMHSIFDTAGNLLANEGLIFDITEKKKKEKAEQERHAAEAAARTKTEMVTYLEEKNSQLEQALQELKTTQMQLIQSEKMAVLGMTAGGVAHDLNNILTGLTSYPEFLLGELEENSPLREPIQAILASGKRAAAVVSDMLTLSKGAASNRENVSLNALVSEYLDSLEFRKLTGDNGNLKIISELSDKPLFVYCSPIHIQKVIMNLITNSIEALEENGELRITTSAQPGDRKSDNGKAASYGVLTITDNGGGIRPQDVEHIFEPFYTRKVMGKSGTGLGLTIVKNVIREHHGHIDLKSDEQGTTFTVSIPLGYDPADKRRAIQADENLTGSGTILLVDDELLQRDLGFRVLSSLGYSVVTVPSGEEALEYLAHNRVEVLILDMMMAPGINGLETYRRAVENNPGQKALIVSGFAANKDINSALELGVSGFVPKPYSISQLGKAVKDLFLSGSSV